MYGSQYLTEENNTLHIDGVAATDLAAQYGTPLYVMAERELTDRLATVREHFLDKYPNTYASFASKALTVSAVYEQVVRHGLGIDVVTGGELFIARQSGVPAERIYFHGSNKSTADLQYAVVEGVGRIVIDHFAEIAQLEAIAAQAGRTVHVLIRIVPQVIGGAHAKIQTGGVDTKFGFSTHASDYLDAIEAILASEHLSLLGIHCHVGSQIQDPSLFEQTARTMMGFVETIRVQHDFTVSEVNVGGGFGIAYTQDDQPLDFEATIARVMDVIETETARLGIERPRIGIEPGRWVVANAGTTLYTVGAIKEIEGVRTYLSVDGGMTDNIRPALYGAVYETVIANRMSGETTEMTVVGAACESGDLVAEKAQLVTPKSGDTLAVFGTGAYNFSMASNYNQFLRPALVFVRDGESREVVRRQTYADLVQCDLGINGVRSES
ncbi:diaminopimelate decarboxylase [Exiguobacterium sp. UBA7533]|uniref:diaminopimelate decarboxylase n=1 Tax=Exiguobacterium sp. UBA7533 TaxID=1946501 RepID=UPI0025C03A4A|nr:diaminopimelate decarboxylase [Exiguobacterium sp. UBA7533]